jgi:hypothetical protein
MDDDGFFKVCNISVHRDDVLYRMRDIYPKMSEKELEQKVNNIPDNVMEELANCMETFFEYSETWNYAFDEAFYDVIGNCYFDEEEGADI